MITIARPRLKDPVTGKDKYDPVELAKKIEAYTEKANPFPSIAQFCYENKISKSRLHEVKAESQILSDAIELLHCRKEYIILYGGASGEINANFAQFLLKQQVHGYSDRSTQRETEDMPVININIPKNIDNA